MKIEFEIENKEKFLNALNHALVAYNEAVVSPSFFNLRDSLPKKFQNAWNNKTCDEIEQLTQEEMVLLKNFYKNIEEQLK